MKSEFMIAITQLAAEKNLPKEVVLQAMEAALVSAYKKDVAIQGNLAVKIDRETGEHHVYVERVIVLEVTDAQTEVSLPDARKQRPDAQLDEVTHEEVHPGAAGRIAAQTAKQVVLQRLREAEREMVFEEFSNREGDINPLVIGPADDSWRFGHELYAQRKKRMFVCASIITRLMKANGKMIEELMN